MAKKTFKRGFEAIKKELKESAARRKELRTIRREAMHQEEKKEAAKAGKRAAKEKYKKKPPIKATGLGMNFGSIDGNDIFLKEGDEDRRRVRKGTDKKDAGNGKGDGRKFIWD